jgi:hypothetical protein
MPSFQTQPPKATESIINSQESIITHDGGERDKVLDGKCLRDKICPNEEKDKEDKVERRRSERLKKEIHLTTKEKNETMAKKKKSGR